jgi:nicotinamide-nucleotide amidase
VGLRAHPGQVDIRVTAKASSASEADALILPVLEKLRARLDDAIFGYENDTLESVLSAQLSQANLKLAAVEHNLGGQLTTRLAQAGVEPDLLTKSECAVDLPGLKLAAKNLIGIRGVNAALGVSFTSDEEDQRLEMVLVFPTEIIEKSRTYGGPRPTAAAWAANTALDFLRRHLSQNKRSEIV